MTGLLLFGRAIDYTGKRTMVLQLQCKQDLAETKGKQDEDWYLIPVVNVLSLIIHFPEEEYR